MSVGVTKESSGFYQWTQSRRSRLGSLRRETHHERRGGGKDTAGIPAPCHLALRNNPLKGNADRRRPTTTLRAAFFGGEPFLCAASWPLPTTTTSTTSSPFAQFDDHHQWLGTAFKFLGLNFSPLPRSVSSSNGLASSTTSLDCLVVRGLWSLVTQRITAHTLDLESGAFKKFLTGSSEPCRLSKGATKQPQFVDHCRCCHWCCCCFQCYPLRGWR